MQFLPVYSFSDCPCHVGVLCIEIGFPWLLSKDISMPVGAVVLRS